MKRIFLSLFVIPIMICSMQPVSATDLRGWVSSPAQNAPISIAGAKVDLYANVQGKWVLLTTAYTDNSGLYYFYKIAPGQYTIQVNGKYNYSVSVDDQPFQDLPYITL